MGSQAKHGSLGTRLLVLVLLAIVDSVLARFAAVASRSPGVGTIYFAVAFMIASTLWFGAWGAIAAYVGAFIGAGILSGIPAEVSLYWSLADLWQVLIPLVAFRQLHADANLRTARDVVVFLVFGWILNNLIGAGWGSTTLAVGGLISRSEVLGAFTTWFASNLIVTIIVTPLLLRFITPLLQKAGLCVREYWS